MNSVPLSSIDAEQREQQDLRDLVQRGDHPFACFVWHATVFGRAGGDVGNCQRVAVVADRVAALVPDQIDFDEPGHHIIPLRPRPDRDLRLE